MCVCVCVCVLMYLLTQQDLSSSHTVWGWLSAFVYTTLHINTCTHISDTPCHILLVRVHMKIPRTCATAVQPLSHWGCPQSVTVNSALAPVGS